MIEKVINPKLIQLAIRAVDWKDAIHQAAQPLIDNNDVTEHYVEGIIRSVKEYGPYFVIAPHVALAHAPSKDGAKKLAMGITTLVPGVNFSNPDNDPVKYIFTLSATDSTSHLKAMQELVQLLSDDTFYQVLDGAKVPQDIMNYVNKAVTTI